MWLSYEKAYAIATSGTKKHERSEAFEALEADYLAQMSEEELAEKGALVRNIPRRCIEEGDA